MNSIIFINNNKIYKIYDYKFYVVNRFLRKVLGDLLNFCVIVKYV